MVLGYCEKVIISIKSAAIEVYVEDVLCHLGSIVEGWVDMSYKIRVFCQRLKSLRTFLF